MRKILRPSAGVLLSALLLSHQAPLFAQKRAPVARPPSAAGVRLARSVVRLENGLTLLMQPDATLPEVGVEVWIRGGAREESPGQFGVAHLFEHHLPSSGRFFRNAGNRALFGRTARGGNAATEPDFVRFYSKATPDGLEAILAALADRLESDPKNFTAERLKRDQDIVVNELRRDAGTDWDAEVRGRLQRGTFGAEHPYGHAVSGSETDVRAATPELMQDWHRRFAGASNALVLVSGNFDPAAAEASVRRLFGSIEPRETAARLTEWVPRARPLREVLEREVKQGAVYMRWPVPAWGTPAGDYLSLLARVLSRRVERGAAEAGSRLSTARAQVELWELAGAFTLKGTFADPASADAAESLLRWQLERLLREGPSAQELALAKAQSQVEFVESLQQPAWRGGRTDVLGLGLLYRDDPDLYRLRLSLTASATPEEVAREGRRWLSEPGYVLRVLPRPARKATAAVDRGATISAPPPKPAPFPEVSEATLATGMRLLTAERTQLPLVRLTLAFDAGSGTDDAATAGRARAALDALMRQPGAAGGATLDDALEALGAKPETRLDEDFASLSVTLLSDRVEEAVRLVASALTRGLTDATVEAARRDALRDLESELKDPLRLRERALACALGEEGMCNPAAGTRGGLARLAPEALRRFYAERYTPANAVLVASGDVNRERLSAILVRDLPDRAARVQSHAGGREAHASAASSGVAARPGGFVVVDYPGSTQAHLLLALRLPPEAASDPLRADVLAKALRTRLMENLRGAKGWSYEVYPFGVDVRRRGALMRFNIPLQGDKLAESIAEIRAEVKRLRDEPVTAEFLGGVKAYAEGDVTAALTSLELLNEQLLETARAGRPAGYYAEALRGLPKLTPEDLRLDALAALDPGGMLWVIAGDRATVERELREAGVESFRVVGPPD
jgi:zinc protease